VLFIAALVGAYLLVGFLTRDKWAGTGTRDGTRVILTAVTPDGSPPSSDALSRAQKVLSERLSDLGGAKVDVQGDRLIVTAPGLSPDQVRGLTLSGRLYIRPVTDSIAATDMPSTGAPAPSSLPGSPPSAGRPPSPPDPAKDRAKAIEFQKLLRQTPGLERYALDYLAKTHCVNDILAGSDDPQKPLVTCGDGATKNQMVYLLDKSIINGDQIESASSAFDPEGNRWVVDVKFNSAAADTWADYTAAHVGTETAFVVDTQVVSAPTIREAIPGGRTQIMGDFTADSARELADTLKSGALPLSFESSAAEPVRVSGAPSTPLRIGLVGAGVGVLGVVIGLVTYLIRRRHRFRNTYAADVTR
jgi:preprotein translocase subunit SecD